MEDWPAAGAQLFEAYSQSLQSDPIWTKLVTAFTLMTFGDTLAQSIDGTLAKSGWSLPRWLRQMTWGAVITPTSHFFYTQIIPAVPPMFPSVPEVVVKSAVDNMLWLPFTVFFFLSLQSVLKGDNVISVLGAKLPGALVKAYQVWTLPVIFLHAAIPTHFQAPFINCIGVVWCVIASMVANAAPVEGSPPSLEVKAAKKRASTSTTTGPREDDGDGTPAADPTSPPRRRSMRLRKRNVRSSSSGRSGR